MCNHTDVLISALDSELALRLLVLQCGLSKKGVLGLLRLETCRQVGFIKLPSWRNAGLLRTGATRAGKGVLDDFLAKIRLEISEI